MGVTFSHVIPQSFSLPSPVITEKNTPDQTGRVHIVTGGYGGVGFELASILYQHNATVYIAGRSRSKYSAAETKITSAFPDSKGKLGFLEMDFSDLPTIAPAVKDFLSKESRLDVLTNNAGVMMPPRGSKDKHGNELQVGTNCLGAQLAYELLRPVLVETAKSAPKGSVRVSWAGSLATDLLSPKPGGVVFEDESANATSSKPKVLFMQSSNYGVSKVGNLYLASEYAKRDKDAGVVHVCFNPGNLATDLQRHGSGIQRVMSSAILYPARYGGYTELWCAVSPDVTPEKSGSFVAPWGRFFPNRADVAKALKPVSDGGSGRGSRFVKWVESETEKYQKEAGAAAAPAATS